MKSYLAQFSKDLPIPRGEVPLYYGLSIQATNEDDAIIRLIEERIYKKGSYDQVVFNPGLDKRVEKLFERTNGEYNLIFQRIPIRKVPTSYPIIKKA